MKEEFLYYVWQYKLFSTFKLFTTDRLEIRLKNSGVRNRNSGPDFLNAQVVIDHQLWAGNVEMHVKSSDWYLHKHEEDSNYEAVILHVVWEHDVSVFMKNNKPLPTLELKNYVNKKHVVYYKALLNSKQNWIPCEKHIPIVDKFTINNWLERLYFERLEQKANLIYLLLEKTNYNFEAVLFHLLAKNFGLKVNGDAFLELATSFDFTILRKVAFDEKKLSALFFGQAGFLNEDPQSHYEDELTKEYMYLKHKYKLTGLNKNIFQFFRMRPNNFPTIRIAQLASLFHQQQKLFSRVLEINNKENFYTLFKIDLHEFWKTHYTFNSVSKKSNKQLSKSFIDLLLINTLIPLKFVYLQNRGQDFEDDILHLIRQISSEKNSIIQHFSRLKIDVKNAMDSQALLELKNNYCTKKRCLQCAIGAKIVRS